MVGWHHQLNGHDFKQTLRDSEGQGSPVCCSPWDGRVGYYLATEQQQMPIFHCNHKVEQWRQRLYDPQSHRVSRSVADSEVGVPSSAKWNGLSGPSKGCTRSFGLVSTSQPATDGGPQSTGGQSCHGVSVSHGMPSVPREVGGFQCDSFLKGTSSLKVKSSLQKESYHLAEKKEVTQV